MSASASDKRFPASASKLRKARTRGEVPHANAEVAAVAAFFGCIAVLGSGFHVIASVGRIVGAMTDLVSLQPSPAVLLGALRLVGREVLIAVLPVLLLPAVGGLLAAFAISGPVVSITPIVPKLQHLNPMDNLKQMFGADGLFRVAHGVACVVLLLLVAGLFAALTIDDAIRLWSATPSATLRAFAGWSAGLMLAGTFALVIAGLAVVLFRRWRFLVMQRMDHEEAMREYREQEGSPEMQSERRARHREMGR